MTLKQLHDEFDPSFAAVYGWTWSLSNAEILPPSSRSTPSAPPKKRAATSATCAPSNRPKLLPLYARSPSERTKALATARATEAQPLTTTEIAKRFARAKTEDGLEILESLAALGRLRRTEHRARWLR